jgi:FMN-dependent NADH-azoreductase
VEADAVVFSSPLYFWGFTAHLKAFIDRCYSLVVNYHKPGHVSLVEGQRQALLVTGGGAYQDNAEGAFAAFDRFVAFCKARKAGELYVAGCSTPADMGPGIRDHAAEFAAQVVA